MCNGSRPEDTVKQDLRLFFPDQGGYNCLAGYTFQRTESKFA